MKSLALAASISFLSLTGCVTSPEPQQHIFDNSRSYDASMQDVWAEAVRFFGENNLPIDTIERDSGLIQTNDLSTSATEFFSYADCSTGPSPLAQEVGYINLSIVIRERFDGSTSAMVNTRFSLYRTFNGMSITFQCTSRGNLEKVILDQISDSVYLPTVDF